MNDFDRRHLDQLRKRLLRQLQSLGLKVTVEPLDVVA
jgi:predicted amino acid-binding ACT domain protein